MTNRWIFAECLDCQTEFRYYCNNTDRVCPECGSGNFEVFPPECCCDCCREKVGIRMKTYNVILSAGIEIERQVEAESEEQARNYAVSAFNDMDIYQAIQNADYVSSTSAEVVESWELRDED